MTTLISRFTILSSSLVACSRPSHFLVHSAMQTTPIAYVILWSDITISSHPSSCFAEWCRREREKKSATIHKLEFVGFILNRHFFSGTNFVTAKKILCEPNEHFESTWIFDIFFCSIHCINKCNVVKCNSNVARNVNSYGFHSYCLMVARKVVTKTTNLVEKETRQKCQSNTNLNWNW